jgi:gamma-glutamyltranspeptidase/glutathione hydrolase
MREMNYDFSSRRSMVTARRGMVASHEPLASQAGLQILREGGNAADAAIATAAMMNVLQPASTGIGGDCFALYYDAKTKQVTAMNGSGRAPKALSIDYLAKQGITESIPVRSVHAATVAGAARGWEDLLKKHGRMSLKQVLAEAIHTAEEGYAVSPVYGAFWGSPSTRDFLLSRPYTEEYVPEGRSPGAGELIRLKGLAKTFRAVAEGGADAFYLGETGAAIVRTAQEQGGLMTMEDLAAHHTTWDEPISIDYRGYQVVEHPPNGQGLAALLALNIAEGWELERMAWDSPEKLHLMIEAMRLAFADASYYIADPATNPAPLAGLLNKAYAQERREMVAPYRAMTPPSFGTPLNTSDTIYLCVVDGEGNACSFINSLYMGFGTGIVAQGTGVFLQNRGANFVLEEGHPNALAGGKRPYHTIIPGMLLRDGEMLAPFGVMGGFMQPQGHFQVINAMIDDDLNPQDALNRPRWQVDADGDGRILVEEGFPTRTMAELAVYGHRIQPISGRGRGVFGRGEIIWRDPHTGVLFGGSEPRADSMIAAY